MKPQTLSVIQLLPELNIGGVERGTLEIAKALIERGHRSIVISAGGRLVDELVNFGSEHIPLDIGKKSLLSLRHIAFLRKYFSQENIDIIHARSRLPAWLAYLAWKKMEPSHRPRFITTVHGPYSVNPYSRVMTKGQKIIAVSNFIRQYITNNYPSVDNKITLIHRGVSKTEFPFAFQADEHWLKTWHSQHPLLSGKFILTMPARITRWKGHEDFISILHHLKQQDLPVHGLVVGEPHRNDMTYLEEIKKKVGLMGLGTNITFLGYRNDVKEIVSISDVVLSLAKKPEAFGRTALESLCLGKPVIAYAHGGTAEVLAKMYPQGCVKPNDIDTACHKVIAFYNAPIPVADNNFFTLDKMIDATLSLYHRV